MKDFRKITFDIKHLSNQEYFPSDSDKSYFSHEDISEMLKRHSSSQNHVIFDGINIEFDNDGCEYSNDSWPWRIHINQSPDADIYFEDDGLYIEHNGYYLKFPDIKSMTIQDFIDGLNLCKVNYRLLNG